MGQTGRLSRGTKKFDYDELQVGEELGSFEYALTEQQLREYRDSLESPTAQFPTIAIKHDSMAMHVKYRYDGNFINARFVTEFFNPPVSGKRLRVTGKVVDKFIKRDKPYLVTQATAVDEDGMLVERVTEYLMCKPEEVGRKWGQ